MANVPNLLPFTTDCTLHLYSASGSTTIDVYYDNGTAGADCNIYIPNYTSTPGDRDISLGHTTQAAPLQTITASSGATVYVMLTYSQTNGMQVYWQTSPFNYQQAQQNALQDGGFFALFASVTTSSGVTVGGGGTTTNPSNGGGTAGVRAL